MKIAFLTRATTGGGAERQLMLLAGGLAARGHEVRVLAFYDPMTAVEGVRVAGLGKRGRWDVLGFFRRLVRDLRADPPAVLHAYLPVANSLAALAKPFVPGLKVVFGVRTARMDLAQYDLASGLAYKFEHALGRAADLVICNSSAAAAASGHPSARCRVIHNGIDTNHFRPDPAAGLRLRAEHQIDAGVPVIGTVGRLDPAKDHDTFFAALARLATAHPRLRALVVGDGSPGDRQRVANAARRHGVEAHVMRLGARSDLAAVYSALDAFCLSSAFGESFPNVVGEAMACAVPCVATDLGDVRELVGNGGRIVSPRDPDALASALSSLLSLPAQERAAIGRQARAHIEARFGVTRLVDETERTLQALVRPT